LVFVFAISSSALAGVDSNGWFTTRGNEPIPAFAPLPTVNNQIGTDPAYAGVRAYWNMRHTFAQYEELFRYLRATYPDTVKLYPIGRTWEERTIWCLEISSNGKSEGKTPLSLVGNIHGGEHESAECVAYTAWWLASGFAANDAEAKKALDGYVWYIIPVMNVDGYVRSMYVNTRENMRPRGLGRDEYFDRNGDGKVGQMFAGKSATSPPYNGGSSVTTSRYAADYTAPQNTDDGYNYLGYEAYDTDATGRFGSSTKQSGIDMNRSFDHFWTLYRPANSSSQGDGYYQLGANGTWNDNVLTRNAGPGPASEPEVQAIQNFFAFNPPVAMITGHTGIQCVLYPWCYTRDRAPDYTLMSTTAEKMRAAFQTTVRKVRSTVGYYQMQSYNDYATSSEMIDWLYGRLGTHAYTVEVYSGGGSGNTWADTSWWTANFPYRWAYLGQVRDGRSGTNQRTYSNVWIYYSTSTIRRGEAPPDQYIMGEGFKDCALAMAYSEPKYTPHPGAPGWMTGNYGESIEVVTEIPPDPFEYNFNFSLKTDTAAINAGDTLYVDVMLHGDINFTAANAKIAFDTALLDFAGYENPYPGSMLTQVGFEAPNKVAVLNVPSTNMVAGVSCDPAAKIVTLKFTVKAGFTGTNVPTNLTFSAMAANPLAGYLGATTAPGKALTITISE
jgi:hypothetical protein